MLPPGVVALAKGYPVPARPRVWRPGPVQWRPVNRVRGGRQQLSADLAVCRRSPGRHTRGRALRQPAFLEGCESGRIGTLGKRVWETHRGFESPPSAKWCSFKPRPLTRAVGVCRFVVESAQELSFDHLGKRVCQPGADGCFVVDLDAVEQRLVPVPASLPASLLVCPRGVVDQLGARSRLRRIAPASMSASRMAW